MFFRKSSDLARRNIEETGWIPPSVIPPDGTYLVCLESSTFAAATYDSINKWQSGGHSLYIGAIFCYREAPKTPFEF